MTIQASEQTLEQVFTLSNYQFEIPSYQRPYSWEKDQVLELIDDLLNAFPYENEENTDYFLGSIILIKKPQNPQVEVVDGQQRLTSLTLLLSVFRHLLPSESNAYQCINDLLEKQGIGSKKYGLKVRSQDDLFFGEYIRTYGGIQVLLEKDTGLETDSQILLRDNTRLLVKELNSRCPENTELESWIVYLLENILNLETINHKKINTSLPSLREIAKLSLEERHQLLSPIIQEIAEDINNDPELNLFSELDGEGLDNNDD